MCVCVCVCVMGKRLLFFASVFLKFSCELRSLFSVLSCYRFAERTAKNSPKNIWSMC